MSCRSILLLFGLLTLTVSTYGDAITIDGRTYSDVLVYESASMYFVKIPSEGRIVSAPKSKVQSSSVSINNDPFYREKLRVQFEKSEADAKQAAMQSGESIDPAFNVPEATSSATGDTSGLYAQGGGRGLGFPKQIVIGALSQQGYKFNGSTGNSADGSVSVQLEGPDDNVSGMVVNISAPQAEMAKIFTGMQQMGAMTAGIAPWAGPWIQQNLVKLQTGQAIQNTQDGVFVSVTPGQNGQNISLTFIVRGA